MYESFVLALHVRILFGAHFGFTLLCKASAASVAILTLMKVSDNWLSYVRMKVMDMKALHRESRSWAMDYYMSSSYISQAMSLINLSKQGE